MIVFPHIEYNGDLSIAQINAGKMPVFKKFAQNKNGVEIEFGSPDLKVGRNYVI